MDKGVVADINADMPDIVVPGIKAEHIPRLNVGGVYMNALIPNIVCYGTCRIAELTENILNKARAVKTGGGGFAAPGIASSEKTQSIIGDFLAEIRPGGTANAACRFVLFAQSFMSMLRIFCTSVSP